MISAAGTFSLTTTVLTTTSGGTVVQPPQSVRHRSVEIVANARIFDSQIGQSAVRLGEVVVDRVNLGEQIVGELACGRLRGSQAADCLLLRPVGVDCLGELAAGLGGRRSGVRSAAAIIEGRADGERQRGRHDGEQVLGHLRPIPCMQSFISVARRVTRPFTTRPPALLKDASVRQAALMSPARSFLGSELLQKPPTPML